MTNSFNEFARAKMFMVIGSNMIEAHPVAATYVKNAVQNGAQLIVVDPRRHPLVDFADIHVPIRVGSDIAFLNGLMHLLIQENLYDRTVVQTCTVGFDELKRKVMEYPPEKAAEICGIEANLIREVARRTASVLNPEAGISFHLLSLAFLSIFPDFSAPRRCYRAIYSCDKAGPYQDPALILTAMNG